MLTYAQCFQLPFTQQMFRSVVNIMPKAEQSPEEIFVVSIMPVGKKFEAQRPEFTTGEF